MHEWPDHLWIDWVWTEPGTIPDDKNCNGLVLPTFPQASFRSDAQNSVKPTLDKTRWILHLCLQCIQHTSTWLKWLCWGHASKYLTLYFQVIRCSPCSSCFDNDVIKFLRKQANIFRLATSLIRFRSEWASHKSSPKMVAPWAPRYLIIPGEGFSPPICIDLMN